MASRHPRYDSTNRKNEEQEELLVFGYSCKLFRDDEKALYIDQGKHLIPWMGDETLKIDRYDVRGTVADLKPLEPLPGGATEAQWSSLSDSERKAEQLCDEERYRALYHNEAEEALYQEEEIKRLHQALDAQHSYGQVAYNYDDGNNSEQQSEDQTAAASADAEEEEEDQPFVAPRELDIPVGMVLPERCKLNAIIEKTALFISNQGPQMEIILKTKQANNPQFEFLSFDCPLHSYYRHLLMAIKTGRYRPKEQKQHQEQQESDADDHYLHPSLAPAPARVELAPSIPSINYKPSADCAYSLLVSKIKDKQLKNAETNSDPSSPQPAAAFAPSSRRRKACKSSGSSSRSNSRSGPSDCSSDSSSERGNTSAASALPVPAVMPPNDIQLIIDKMALYVMKNGRDFEAVVRTKGDPRFGFLDATHAFHPYYEYKVKFYHLSKTDNSSGPSAGPDRPKKRKKREKPKLVLLPQYQSSSSDSENESPRKDNVKRKASKVQTPVCFSIKKPKEAEILQEIRSALPLDLEESSEEDEENKDKKEEKKDKESSDNRSNKDDKDRRRSRSEASEEMNSEKEREEELRKTQKIQKEKERELKEKEAAKKRSEDIFQIPEPEKKEKPKQLSDQLTDLMTTAKEETNTPIDIDDDDLITEAEIIDLTDDKVVVSNAKESELKLERKRRAAAFLNRIKGDRQLASNGSSKVGSQVERTLVPSPSSPPRLTELNGSTVPKHSLLARLAASNVVSKQPPSISIDRKHRHKKTETSGKRSRSRSSSSGRQSKRDKKHKRKRPYDSPEYDRSRTSSRSRSRSVMSPVKGHHRRQREHVQDHRANSYYDYDREDASYSRYKSFKQKSHRHVKHRRDYRTVENDGEEEMSGSHKYKYIHKSHSRNEPSSDSSEE